MPACLRLCEAHLSSANCLIGKPLQPQHPSQEHAGRQPCADLVANEVPRMIGKGRTRQHTLQVASRTGLVTNMMFGHAQHALGEQLIGRVRPACCKIMEPLRKRQGSVDSIVAYVIGI